MSTLFSGEQTARPVERHSLHFDFSHLDLEREYTFNHSLVSIALQRHDAASLFEARKNIPLLKVIPDKHLTHFIDIDLPSDCLALLYVTTLKDVGGKVVQHPVHLALHIPNEGRKHARDLFLRERYKDRPALHPKLMRLGATLETVRAILSDDDYPSFPAHINTFQDATTAAIALVFQHSNLINLNTDNGGKIPAIIEQHITDAVTDVGDLSLQILGDGDAWMQTTTLTIPGSDKTTTATVPADDVVQNMTGTLQTALVAVKNDPLLEGQQWNLLYGSTTDTYDGKTSGLPGKVVTSIKRDTLEDDGYKWTAANKTGMNGLTVDAGSISYSPATDTYSSTGLWSANDTPALSKTAADALKGNKMYFQVNTGAYPNGLLSCVLTAGTADPDTGLLPLNGTLALIPTDSSSPASGTISASLNSGNTGLTYNITLSGIDDDTVTGYFYTDAGTPLFTTNIISDSGTGILTISVTNHWLRHLSACVQYLDEAGNVLTPPDWHDKVPGFLRHTFEPDATKPFIALIPPVTTVFGVPIPADPTQLTIPIWDDVHTVKLLMGGLGQGSYDAAVCPIGITVTILAELVLPVFILAAGAAITNSNAVKSLLADPEVLFAVCTAGAFLAGGAGAAAIATAQNPASAAKGMAAEFGPMLLSPATSLGKWVAEKFSEGAAERAAPFVDIALAVINGAVTAAELAQTIIEVLDSPFVFETDITRSMGLQVQLIPDHRYHKFPDHHDTLQVIVAYDTGTTQPSLTQSLPATTLNDPITVTFASVPAGGKLKIYAFFYAANGWPSGQGQTGWIQASSNDGNSLVVNGLEITTNEIPLNNKSVYMHQEKTGMSDNTINWIAAVDIPPVVTLGNMNAQMLYLSAITIAQEPEMIGYCWQATGLNIPPDTTSQPASNDALWTLQNLSVLQDPQSGYAYPDIGFTSKAGIAYNIASDDNSSTNFFIDASNPDFDSQSNPSGGFHIRSLNLAYTGPAPVFNCGSNQSYGRFPDALDKYIYHPQGYVIGFSITSNKLYICKLSAGPVADTAAGMATLASGPGDREGLLQGPAGLAVALDGRILILESLNKRIQAFDLHGTPVAYFPDPAHSGQKVASLPLIARTGSTYLDVAVESQGYIYVMSYTGSGNDPSDYNMDLYKPDGTFLVTTTNIPAAAITVDILRNIFTLNYENFIDSNQRPHPSVSLWLPPAPDPSVEAPEDSLQHSIQGTFMGKWRFNGQGRPAWNFGNDYGGSDLLLVYQIAGISVPGFVNCVCQINAGADNIGGPAALPFCSPLVNTQNFYTIGAQAYDQPDATIFSYRQGNPSTFISFNGPDYAPFGWFVSEGWGDFFGWDDAAIMSQGVPLQVDVIVPSVAYIRTNLNNVAPANSDYSFVDLSGNDLSNLTLTGANFSNGDLTGANFNGSQLQGAVFNYGFSFAGATFVGANLEGAQFNNCDLSKVDFSGANMDGVSFTGTRLTGALFTPANGTNCSLKNVNFKDCTDITQCSFKQADLTNCIFSGNNVSGVDFTGAILADITLPCMDLTKATFSLPAAFSSTKQFWPDLSGSTFLYPLIGLQWTAMNLNNSTIEQLPDDLSNLKAQSTSLQGLTFSKKNFASADFSNANLQNCSLSGCNLDTAIFSEALLQGDAQLRAAILSGANLKNAIFHNANLSHVDFSGAFFWGSKATVSGAVLVNTNFSNAYLTGVDFSAVSQNQCQGCIFDYACLINTKFTQTRAGKLSVLPSSFAGACLQGADFTDAQLDSVNLSNATLSQQGGDQFSVTILFKWPGTMQTIPVTIKQATLGIQTATTTDSVCPDTTQGPCSVPQQKAINPARQWPVNASAGEEPPHYPEEGQRANWLARWIRWWFRF